MSDSDAPLFHDSAKQIPDENRPDLESPAEEPLGLKNPLLPARSLGLNQRFLVPLGAQSLSILDTSIFQSDGIQRDFLDSPFQDSPFFSDADLTSSVDPVSVGSQEPTKQDSIQLQRSSSTTSTNLTAPETQVLRDAGVPQSGIQEPRSPLSTPSSAAVEQSILLPRSPLPSETQQSTSEVEIQRSPDKISAPSSENLSESSLQLQAISNQSNILEPVIETIQQSDFDERNQPSFSKVSQIKESQPSFQPLQSAEPEIQLSQDEISVPSSEDVAESSLQLQKSINQSNELELDVEPEYQATSSENIQRSSLEQNQAEILQASQISDSAKQRSQEISFKQSSDTQIQPQQSSSHSTSLDLNSLEPDRLDVDNTSIPHINKQQTDVNENSPPRSANNINSKSSQSIIQPSRSLNVTSQANLEQSDSPLELSTSLEPSPFEANQDLQPLATIQNNAEIQPPIIAQTSEDRLARSPQSIQPTSEKPVFPKPLIDNFVAKTQFPEIQTKFEPDELTSQQKPQVDSNNLLLLSNHDVSSETIQRSDSEAIAQQPNNVSLDVIQRSNTEAIAQQQLDDVETSETTPLLSTSAASAIVSETIIQPSRSPSSSESSSLDSTQPVHNFDIAEQPNSELPTSNLEPIVPSNDISPIQKTSEHDKIALAPSAEHPANSLLQTENEIIQSKIIVSANSANDEISTNINNTFQQSVSNAIASPLPLDSTATTPSQRQLENNESVLQQSPIALQAQISETTEIESKLTDAIQKKELIETDSSLGQTPEPATTPSIEQFAISNEVPTVQAAEEPAIREPLAKLSTELSTGITPKFNLQSIENLEAAKPFLDLIKTENLNSSATAQTHSSNLEDSSSPLSTAFISDSSVPNQPSETALSKSPQLENAPTVQPQLAENNVEEITQLAPTPSPSSETSEVIETNARSLAEPTISLQLETQFSSAELVNSPLDPQFSLDSLDQPIANSTALLPSDKLVEPITQPVLETTTSVLQPQLETITASDGFSSPPEQLSSEEIAISTEAIAETLPDATETIAPLVSEVHQEVNPVISRAVDLSTEGANSDAANAVSLLETSSENQAELLQLKALTENTNAQNTNIAQALNEVPAARLNQHYHEHGSDQLSEISTNTNEVHPLLSRAVDDIREEGVERSQSSFEQAQALPGNEQVFSENAIASSDLIVQELQLDNNEAVQKASEQFVINQPVISTRSTEISDRATNQNVPETTIEQPLFIDLASIQASPEFSVRENSPIIQETSTTQTDTAEIAQPFVNASNTQLDPLKIISDDHLEPASALQPKLENSISLVSSDLVKATEPATAESILTHSDTSLSLEAVDLNTSKIATSALLKDSLQRTTSIHEPSMIDVSESLLSFDTSTQTPIDQAKIEALSPQPSLTSNADSIAAESVINSGTNQVDGVASQFNQADTFQPSNTINQANLPPETAATLEETIQRENQQSSDTTSANAEIITQQIIQNSQAQADSEQSEIESFIQRSPILEKTIQRSNQQSEIESINLEEKAQQVIPDSQAQLEIEQSEVEPVIQRSPTSEKSAIALSTQPQLTQAKSSEIIAPQSNSGIAEQRNVSFIHQNAETQIISESDVNQVFDSKRHSIIQADFVNPIQPNITTPNITTPNITTGQPTTIIQSKLDSQKVTTEPAEIQPKQTRDNRTSSAGNSIINTDFLQEQTAVSEDIAIAARLEHSAISPDSKSVDKDDQFINQSSLDQAPSFLNPPNLIKPAEPILESRTDSQIQRQPSHDASGVNPVSSPENQAIEIDSPTEEIQRFVDSPSVDSPSVDEIAVVHNPIRPIDIDSSTEKIQRFADNRSVDDTAIAQHLTSPNIDASDTLPLHQQVNFEQFERSQDERSQIIDIAPISTPSIQPSEHLFDRPASIPQPSIQRSVASLDSLELKPNSPAPEINQPDSIPELPQVLQNLTVLRSLTQPQPLAQPLERSDVTVQAKSLQSQLVQAKSLHTTDTPNLPLLPAIPIANVPAESPIDQSVLNRKLEPVKVASTSSDRISRQWSTLNELVQGQTVPSRRGLAAKIAPAQKSSSSKATNPTIQAKFAESSTPVRVTRQTSPTIRREGGEFQDEDVDDIDYLEALAQAIYDRLRQRMRIEQERHGRDYSGRLPW